MPETDQSPQIQPVAGGEGRRVVVAFHETHLGGATRSIERVVPLLERAGWRFSFWTPRPSELFDELSSRGWDVDGAGRVFEYSVRAWRLPPGSGDRLRRTPEYVRHLQRFVAEREPALAHANSILTLAEALIMRRSGVPTLLHAHEMLPGDPRGRLLRGVAWRNLDAIVAVSDPCAKRLIWRGRRPVIAYEGAPIPDSPVPIRKRPRPFVVGTVAVVSRRKGSDLFVEAARILKRRERSGARDATNGAGDRFRFEMVGAPSELIDRDWAGTVLTRARSVGVDHAPCADVFARFRGWDAFVLPSRADPFPLSMLEAMASGLPAVGASTDGITEQLVPGTGVLVEPENPKALADAIAWIAGQGPEVRASLGAAARSRVIDSFSLAHQAAAIDQIYRSILTRRPAPARALEASP